MARKSTEEDLFETLKGWVQEDISAPGYRAWQTRAKENFRFITPWGQWTEEEKSELTEQMRPIISFNKTNKFLRAICGIEVNNRLQTSYVPREPDNAGEVKANELLSDGASWMDETSDAPRHQSRAFRDANICGVGCTESSISYDDDPEGLYIEERIYPREMFWDKNSRDQNFEDAKRVGRIRQMSLKEARELIPGVTSTMTVEDLDASWAEDVGATNKGDPKTQKQKERRDESRADDNDPKRNVKIVQIQWWEYEAYVRAVNPNAGMPKEDGSPEPKHKDMDPEQFKLLNEQFKADPRNIMGEDLPSSKLRRKVFKQAFIGGKLLQEGPAPRPDGFTFNFVTAEPDDEDGSFYSLVDLLKDPQKWSNKFFSQMMHIINSSAKGGIMAERGAFADVKAAMANYGKPNGVTILEDGAIAKGKVMAKPGGAITAGVAGLLERADAAFPDVTGMNLELMGMADREQAGVLEAQRKQSAMTILATIFDARSLMKKNVGRTKLYFLQNHLMSDERWIRIDGKDGPVAKKLTANDVGGKYDTIVGDAPSAPDTKERAWVALQPVLPFFIEQGSMTPDLAAEIIDFIPGLPTKLQEAFKKALTQPKPGADEQAALAKEGAVAQIEKDKGSAQQSNTAAVLNLARATEANAKAREAELLTGLKDYFSKMMGKPPSREADDAEIIGPDRARQGASPMQQLPQMFDQEPQQSLPPEGLGGIVPPGGLNGNGGF